MEAAMTRAKDRRPRDNDKVNPLPLAAATSELLATGYGTQNGTTAEVPDENATARADAATATATPGSLADGAHDLPTIRRVRVDAVMIGNGRRACNPEQVRMIADSMAQIGLINPITVTTAQTLADVGASRIGATFNLVAGRQRLEAHKLLGWTHIDAIVVAGDRTDDRLREIAENLWRVELTVLERAELIEEWTQLIKEKVGQVAHPGGFQPNDQGISRAAKELGLTRELVRRSKVIAGISPEAKAAAKAGRLSDNQKALLDIAKQPTLEAQVKKVREKVAGKQTARHNAKAAMVTPPTATPSASPDTGEGLALPAFLDRRNPEEVYASLKAAWANSPGMMAAWGDAPSAVRERFIAEVLLNSATTTPALNALIGKTSKRAKHNGLLRGEVGDE
jgi:ParB family chromosome partitioning protein